MAAKFNVKVKMVRLPNEDKRKLRQKIIEAMLNKDE